MTGEADLTFFRQVIRMYIDQGDEQIIDIKDALSRSDIDRLGSIAHKLKGSSLNLGAEAVAETCRSIELKAREKSLIGMSKLIDELVSQFASTKKLFIFSN
jgi:HPt (histidine-containing phosphotransfer) domain-containing protein